MAKGGICSRMLELVKESIESSNTRTALRVGQLAHKCQDQAPQIIPTKFDNFSSNGSMETGDIYIYIDSMFRPPPKKNVQGYCVKKIDTASIEEVD